MNGLYGRPTAAELVAAVADFLDNDVRASVEGPVNFHARVAANVLRIVERELLDDSTGAVAAALADLGFADEAQLAAAIRAGHSTTAPTTCCVSSHARPPPARSRAPRLRRVIPGRERELGARLLDFPSTGHVRRTNRRQTRRARASHAGSSTSVPTGRPIASACGSCTTPR